MSRRRNAPPVVPATTPLKPDVSAVPPVDERDPVPPIVDPALVAAAVPVAGDTTPVPVVDVPAGQVAGDDAVAAASAVGSVLGDRSPLVPVPATTPLPPDQITPRLPVGEAIAATVPAERRWADLLADADPALVERIRADLGIAPAAPAPSIEQRWADLLAEADPAMRARFVGDLGADRARYPAPDLAPDEFVALRDRLAGDPALDADAGERRAFLVVYDVLHDGRMVRPSDPDGLALTEAEHAGLFGTAVLTPWDDGARREPAR